MKKDKVGSYKIVDNELECDTTNGSIEIDIDDITKKKVTRIRIVRGDHKVIIKRPNQEIVELTPEMSSEMWENNKRFINEKEYQ
jgi:hypothetical protein